MWAQEHGLQTIPPDTDAGWVVALPKLKRCKIEVACATCRLRKSRCDGKRPKCGACIKRKGVGPVCVYSEQTMERVRQISTYDATDETSSTTIQQHEQELRSLPNLEDSPAQVRNIPDAHRQNVTGKKNDNSTLTNDVTNGGNDWILNAGLLAASSSANFFNTIFGTSNTERRSQSDPKTATEKLNEMARTSPSNDPLIAQRSAYSGEYVLPPRKVADGLLGLFFKHAYIQWIDRLEFVRWYEGLWTGTTETEDVVDEQIHYATLNIIFALVYRSEPDQFAEDHDQLAQAYFLRAQKLLQLNLLGLNRLNLLYALLLLLQWFQSVNDVQRCMSLIRLCILIARNLGLHMPVRIESLRSQRQREMARRAWHGCILMDRIIAMISGQPLQVSREVASQTPLFEAIDDENLSNDEIKGVQPLSKISTHSFFLAFCQLHIILADVLAPLQDGRHGNHTVIDVNHIISVDDSLHRFSNALPPQLQFRRDTQDNSTYTGPIVHLHARLLHIRIILYRSFFLYAAEKMKHSSSPSSSRFAESVTREGLLTCVRAAQEILSLIRSRLVVGDMGPRLVPQWWHTVTYVYTAVTILIAAHIFPHVVEEITIGSLATSIQEGFQILEHHSGHKQSVERCMTALTVLCERHGIPGNSSPQHTPHGTLIPLDTSIWSQSPKQTTTAANPVDFGWNYTDIPDLFRGESMESLLFNTNLFGQVDDCF